MKIAVAGAGYVGLSLAALLSRYHPVTLVDTLPEKTLTSETEIPFSRRIPQAVSTVAVLRV